MKWQLGLRASCFVLLAQAAFAHVYPLQFTPNAGSRGLVIAGYAFKGTSVLGTCSYYTVQSGSGRGGGYHSTTTYYNQTCTWDLYGNLLSVTPGAPAVPAALYVKGTQTVYALNANGDFTGSDTSLPYGGFVNTPGSHYTWTTSNAYMVIPQVPYTFTTTLVSDGDVPLHISAVETSALRGAAAVKSSTCAGQIPVNTSCAVTVVYNPAKLRSPTGLAYDTLTINVVSDAGQAPAFVQSYTIVLNAKSDEDASLLARSAVEP